MSTGILQLPSFSYILKFILYTVYSVYSVRSPGLALLPGIRQSSYFIGSIMKKHITDIILVLLSNVLLKFVNRWSCLIP